MTRIDQIEQQVQQLSREELAAFRKWFTEFEADAWDRQIEADALAGRLDHIAKQAIRDHRAGKSRPL